MVITAVTVTHIIIMDITMPLPAITEVVDIMGMMGIIIETTSIITMIMVFLIITIMIITTEEKYM